LPTFTFGSPFCAPKQACGPEASALRGKSIGGEKILPGDPAWLPQNGAGRSGARPGAPTSENPCSRRKNGLPARPKKRGVPHDFCAQCPCFWAGHGLKFNRLYTHLEKSEGGQVRNKENSVHSAIWDFGLRFRRIYDSLLSNSNSKRRS
jgi:hypothetical protein